jgi:hypothetical protein
MQTVLALATIALTLAAMAGAPPALADLGRWARTEVRDDCDDFDVLRRPFFGDLHVHTTYSFDAVSGDVRTGPRDAYRFAQGEAIPLPPYDGLGTPLRSAQIGRPLDFAAVTDHSELFGEVQTCLTPGLPGYDSDECADYRADIPQLDQFVSPGIQLFAFNYLALPGPIRFEPVCGVGAVDCLAQASLVWQDTQAAAEEFYDRTASCGFTTFVAYEWTGNTGVQNLHRNVIFRNTVVPPLPISYVEQPNARLLWNALKAQCLDPANGCDVLAIPHNSNLSNGIMFRPLNQGQPLTAADAAFRAAMEPVVEVTQHKGDSECRTGVLTNDELCGFEKWSGVRIGLPPSDPQTYTPLLFVRNALKEGLVQEQLIGVNPFRLGMIGSTDSHNSTPGAVREDDYQGALGTRDATPALMMAPNAGLGVIGGAESNPGGLAVVWAEENSRDALFDALRRREVYATSGPRPLVRFFAGELADVACDRADLVTRAYETGTPMGGELGPVLGEASPRFAVLASKDPGEPGVPGTPLQRIQIVKGWVDASGTAQEQVFEVAGDPMNGATVDTATCATSGPGSDSLCAVWTDPQFDREERAFYYARVIENPVCRWSTRLCNAQGVDCSGVPPAGLEECCNPDVPKTIQERAWTSPVWYRPEAFSGVKAEVTFGRINEDRLRLRAGFGRVPADVDLDSQEVRVTVADDDTIYDVTLPPGTFSQTGARRWLYRDPDSMLGNLRRVSFRVNRRGEGLLRLQTGRMNLASADRTDHMVKVRVALGDHTAEEARLWNAVGRRLETAR